MPPSLRRSRRLQGIPADYVPLRQTIIGRNGLSLRDRQGLSPLIRRDQNRSRSRSRSRSPSPATLEHRRLIANRQADETISRAHAWNVTERQILHSHRLNRAIDITFTQNAGALQNTYRNYDINYDIEDFADLSLFLVYLKRKLRVFLRSLFSELHGLQWNITINILYQSGNDGHQRTTAIHSSFREVLTVSQLYQSIDAALGEIDLQHTEYQEGRSDWIFMGLVDGSNIQVKPARVSARIQGSGHLQHLIQQRARSFIALPLWVKEKQAVINVDNTDQRCFWYAMEIAWHHKHDSLPSKPGRSSQYHLPDSHFNYGELTFPIHTNDLDTFERLNSQLHLRINVYHAGDNLNEFSVLRHASKDMNDDDWVVNLLFLVQRSDEHHLPFNNHWVYIKHMHKFVGRPGHRRAMCTRCLRDFNNDNSLANHKLLCNTRKPQVEVLPFPFDAYRSFKNMYKKNAKPFVIYADFESFNKPIASSETTGSRKLTEHVVASYCFQVVCREFPKYNWIESYTTKATTWEEHSAKELTQRFLKALLKAKNRIMALIDENFMFDYSNDDLRPMNDNENDTCVVCLRSIEEGFLRCWRTTLYDTAETWPDGPSDYYKIKAMIQKQMSINRKLPTAIQDVLFARNSCRVNAHYPHKEIHNYRGPAHHACAFSLRRYGKIPVIFHNLSGYDGHLILQSLDPILFEMNTYRDGFNCIPQAGDKFMTFSFSNLEFIDSFRFLGTSLDTLTENLRKGGSSDFNITHKVMSTYLSTKGIHYSPELASKLMKKGQFPYEYFDGPARLSETQLPSIECFHNTLHDQDCSPDNYRHAQEIWRDLNCTSFRDYHDAYLLLDVVLLSDIFENFRSLCLREDHLEPLHYISLPGYSFDSAMILSHRPNTINSSIGYPFELELFKKGQEDMYEFVEASIRGGISMTPGRMSQANHKYLGSHYDPTKPSVFILDQDANNLYGDGMSAALPYGAYGWCEDVDSISLRVIIDDILSYDEENKASGIYEVDGYFPNSTHDYLADFPPCPSNDIIPLDLTSPYYQDLCKRMSTTHDDKTRKLLCSLLPKQKYKVNKRSLKQYIELGFVITRVHRILEFAQSKWLAYYINYNTIKRAAATNPFEKDFFKLKNNAVYGKMIQDNRKFQTVKAITPENYLKKSTWELNMTGFRIVNENLILAYVKRGRINLNSPVAVGSVILDNAKWRMYYYWYQHLKPTFDTRLRLLFMDTDSFCVEIFTPDVMTEMKEKGLINEQDLADWPKDTSYHGANYYDSKNKKVIGKFKDVFAETRQYVYSCIALRSKMYSLEMYPEIINSHNEVEREARAKGVSRAITRKITHQQYVECLHNANDYQLDRQDMYRIGSQNNQLFSSVVHKVTLSPHDSKSYLVDATHTLPYGHYRIPQIASSSSLSLSLSTS